MRALLLLVGLFLISGPMLIGMHAAGGASNPEAWMIALAAVAAVALAIASVINWHRGAVGTAFVIAALGVCADGYNLLSSTDRVLLMREHREVLFRAASERRLAAVKALADAEVALRNTDPNAREKAAQTAADKAASEALEASKSKTCPQHGTCAAQIETQRAAIIERLQRARADDQAAHDRRVADLESARAALEALPVPVAASPTAIAIGVPAWLLDVLSSAAAAVAINVGGLMLVSIAVQGIARRIALNETLEEAHLRSALAEARAVDQGIISGGIVSSSTSALQNECTRIVAKLESLPSELAPRKILAVEDHSKDVVRFLETCLSPGTEADYIEIKELYEVYEAYCSGREFKALTTAEFRKQLRATVPPAAISKRNGGLALAHVRRRELAQEAA